jgi:hypothetical protein
LRFFKSFVLIKVRKKEDTMNSRKTCTLILKLTAGTVICTAGTAKAQALPSETGSENSSSRFMMSNTTVNPASNPQQTPTSSNPIEAQQVEGRDTSASAEQPIARTLLHATPFPEREVSALGNIANPSLQEKPIECDPHQATQSQECSRPAPLSVPSDPERSIFLQALGDSSASALQGTTERNISETPLLRTDLSSSEGTPMPATETTTSANGEPSQIDFESSTTENEAEPTSDEENLPSSLTEMEQEDSSENYSDSTSSNATSNDTESELNAATEGGEGWNINFNFSDSPSDIGSGATEEFLGSDTGMDTETTLPTSETTTPESGVTETTQSSPRKRQHKNQKLRKQIREELRKEWRRKRNRQKRRQPSGLTQSSNSSNPGINNKMNQDIYKHINRKVIRKPRRRMRVRSFRKHKMVFRQRSPRMRMRQPGLRMRMRRSGGLRMRNHRPFRMKRGRR